MYDQMYEINLLELFNAICQLALLKENSVSETGPVSVFRGP